MFCSYLPIFVCARVHLLFMFFFVLFAHSAIQHVLTMWVTRWISYERQQLLPIAGIWGHTRFYCLVRVVHLFSFFCDVLLCVFAFLVPCCDALYVFRIKLCSFGFCLQLFVGELVSYLCYSYLFVYSSVQYTLCCVVCFVCLRLVSWVPNAASLFGLYILVLAVFPCCYRFIWSYEEFLPHLNGFFFSKTLENVDIESYLL